MPIYNPSPGGSSITPTFNQDLLEPTGTVTLTDGYCAVVAGEYWLDANVEQVVGGIGGQSELAVI